MITVSMIVKNEEEVLEECLKSLGDLDVVICDTGSEDKTVEIAEKYGKVYTGYTWKDNFAEARNYCLDKCQGDWILIIDADEVLEDVEAVKKAVAKAKGDALNVKVYDDICQEFWSVRLFRNNGKIKWEGAIHNHLNQTSDEYTDVKIKFGYSPAHKKDPDRALRILTKEVDKNHRPRETFYLAREYVYRSDWNKAIAWYEEYLAIAWWRPEICEAYLQLARCYWNLREGEKARDNCLQAIKGNPNFKEALLFMAEMSWEEQAQVWRKFAEIADNSNVLFIRN